MRLGGLLALDALRVEQLRRGSIALALRPYPQEAVDPRQPFGGGLDQWSVNRNTKGEIVRHGSYTMSHPNGQKAFEGTYRNGQLHGAFRYWDPSGNLISQGRFRNGKLIDD